MDKFSLYVPNFIPGKESIDMKHINTCIGCGVALAVRQIGKVAGDLLRKAVWDSPSEGTFFSAQSGVQLLRIKQGKNQVVFGLDDEPDGSLEGAAKKTLPAIAVAEGFNYVATACPSYPFDLFEKVKKALETDGKAYVHILCPCPLAWQFPTEDTVKVGFKAVESLAFPLYEAGSGFFNQTIKTMKPKSFSEYIRAQDRFSGESDEAVQQAGQVVEKQYNKLLENLEGQMSYTCETTGEVY